MSAPVPADPALARFLAGAGAPAGVGAVPALETRREAEQVRGLQVRTNAVQFALAAAAGKHVSTGDLIAAAREIARYITGS